MSDVVRSGTVSFGTWSKNLCFSNFNDMGRFFGSDCKHCFTKSWKERDHFLSASVGIRGFSNVGGGFWRMYTTTCSRERVIFNHSKIGWT